MKYHVVSALLFILAAAMSIPALAKNIHIEIITENGCPVAVEPDESCAGSGEDVCFKKGVPNKVTWKYKGSSQGKPDFQIVMKSSADHMIFTDGCHDSAKSVACEISDSAPVGSYAYSVINADGCEYDPRIIINDDD